MPKNPRRPGDEVALKVKDGYFIMSEVDGSFWRKSPNKRDIWRWAVFIILLSNVLSLWWRNCDTFPLKV